MNHPKAITSKAWRISLFVLFFLSNVGAATERETLKLNLTIGLESGDSKTVGYDGDFFTDPAVSIELKEVESNSAALNVSKEWEGIYLVNVNKADFKTKKTIKFQFKMHLFKTEFTDGSVNYFLSLQQDRRSLVGLTSQTLEGFKAVGISQLQGREIDRNGDNYFLPLITIE